MSNGASIDRFGDDSQCVRVQRLATFLLLFCVTVGLAAQQPAQALGAQAVSMDMKSILPTAMSAMPDCMAAMARDATHKPCKCGMGGCIAMMSSGAAMMLPNDPGGPIDVAASERQVHVSSVPSLRGRATVPEPEPPSLLT